MNDLSWMIYLAGAVDGLRTLFGITIGIAGIGAAFALLGHFIEEWQPGLPIAKKLIAGCIAGGVCVALIPNQTTMFAIIASQMGEQALNTETGGKAVKALNAWLDRQIAAEMKDDSE